MDTGCPVVITTTSAGQYIACIICQIKYKVTVIRYVDCTLSITSCSAVRGGSDIYPIQGDLRISIYCNAVRGRIRRPAGHGDGDVRAAVDGEDAVGVGVAAGIPLYFKSPGGSSCLCCLRRRCADGQEADEERQREQCAQNFSAELTHGRGPLSRCAGTRKTDARRARRFHAADASVKVVL